TREHHQEADHNTFHRLLVFIVSAALSQAKSWRAQSPIRKTPCQNSEFQSLRG
ncbi:Bgt-20976, partial [Blumeria graminis f. sp. tritici]